MHHFVQLAFISVLFVAACGSDEPSSVRAGDACETSDNFRCATDEAGDKTGELLVCTAGAYEQAMQCGDPAGCFTEASNSAGRCFHGDGTGNVCTASGGTLDCCSFTEPDIGSCN